MMCQNDKFGDGGGRQMEAEVTWSWREKSVVCHSLAEIDALLDRAHAASSLTRPALAVVTHQGYGLCIGLGIDPTVIEIHYPPCDGEYYTSVGDEAVDDLVDFFGHEGHYQYRRNTFVPMAEARRTIRDFIKTGRRSEEIRWRDWRESPTESGAGGEPTGMEASPDS